MDDSDMQQIWTSSNPSCSHFSRCVIFAGHIALSTWYSGTHLSDKCALFHPYQKAGPEAVCIHVQWTKVHIYTFAPRRPFLFNSIV